MSEYQWRWQAFDDLTTVKEGLERDLAESQNSCKALSQSLQTAESEARAAQQRLVELGAGEGRTYLEALQTARQERRAGQELRDSLAALKQHNEDLELEAAGLKDSVTSGQHLLEEAKATIAALEKQVRDLKWKEVMATRTEGDEASPLKQTTSGRSTSAHGNEGAADNGTTSLHSIASSIMRSTEGGVRGARVAALRRAAARLAAGQPALEEVSEAAPSWKTRRSPRRQLY